MSEQKCYRLPIAAIIGCRLMAHRGRDRRRQLTAGLENGEASSQSCQTNQTLISQRTLSETHQKHRLADKLRYHKIAGMWSGNHKTSFLNRNFRSKILKKIGKIFGNFHFFFIFSSSFFVVLIIRLYVHLYLQINHCY